MGLEHTHTHTDSRIHRAIGCDRRARVSGTMWQRDWKRALYSRSPQSFPAQFIGIHEAIQRWAQHSNTEIGQHLWAVFVFSSSNSSVSSLRHSPLLSPSFLFSAELSYLHFTFISLCNLITPYSLSPLLCVWRTLDLHGYHILSSSGMLLVHWCHSAVCVC